MATMSTTERTKRSKALKAFHARRREANERRSFSVQDYWDFGPSSTHRRKLSLAMKKYWRTAK